jgi:hypothetical protein
MAEWIGVIVFSPEVEAKLRAKHNLTPERVYEAVAWGGHHHAGWHTDPVYGRRLILSGEDADGVSMIVYLRPVDRSDGVWKCLTAWRED